MRMRSVVGRETMSDGTIGETEKGSSKVATPKDESTRTLVIGRDSRTRVVTTTPDQVHCIVTSDGNHVSVGDVSGDTEVITEADQEILANVVPKQEVVEQHSITVTGVSLAEIHGHGDHEGLIEVQDPLHHHVSVNMGNHHHHHEDNAGNTIITIPVGSLAPYTVIANSETNGGSTIAVSLAQDSIPLQQQHHQLIQQSQSQATPQCNSHLTWEEAVSAPVLPIRCKDTNAELHKSKFGSGNKGKCIKLGNDWFTPTEFEALCGRGNSKDWKRSIRFGGRTLQTLIDKGFLIPHASSCICSNCVDDATATGPIRPFTPYQRKRKGQSTDHLKGSKLERLTSKDSNTDESSDVATPGTPLSLASGLNPLTQALIKINQMSLPPCTQEAWKVVEDAVDGIINASATLKSLVLELKERTNQETESLRSQLQSSVQTTLVQNPIVGQPQILRIFDSNRIQTYSIEVLDPDSFKPLPGNTCENCGREGTLECSGCHVVHYCSSFCQKKDWPNHQTVCTDRRQTECKPEPQLS